MLTIVGGQLIVIKNAAVGTGAESEEMEERMALWKGLEHGATLWCGPHRLRDYDWFWKSRIKIIIIMMVRTLLYSTLLYLGVTWRGMRSADANNNNNNNNNNDNTQIIIMMRFLASFLSPSSWAGNRVTLPQSIMKINNNQPACSTESAVSANSHGFLCAITRE